MRIEKNGVRYFSLSELAEAYNIKPRQMDKDKKDSLTKKFESKHICRACKKPLTLSSGNVLVCSNPECKGIKCTRENQDGTTTVWYEPSFELLDEIGENIASKIY